MEMEEIDPEWYGDCVYVLLPKKISERVLLFPFPPEQETWTWGVLGGFLLSPVGSGYIRSCDLMGFSVDFAWAQSN